MVDIVRTMTDALPLRIFLASPSDLASEREVVRRSVVEHNARQKGQSNVTYEVVGWDRIRGTARRPQEAINRAPKRSCSRDSLNRAVPSSRCGTSG